MATDNDPTKNDTVGKEQDVGDMEDSFGEDDVNLESEEVLNVNFDDKNMMISARPNIAMNDDEN